MGFLICATGHSPLLYPVTRKAQHPEVSAPSVADRPRIIYLASCLSICMTAAFIASWRCSVSSPPQARHPRKLGVEFLIL